MKLVDNEKFNNVLTQVSRNNDRVFDLLSTVQGQFEKISNMVIDEATANCKTVSEGVITSAKVISDESINVAKSIIGDSIEVLTSDNGEILSSAVNTVIKKTKPIVKKVTKSAEKTSTVAKKVASTVVTGTHTNPANKNATTHPRAKTATVNKK